MKSSSALSYFMLVLAPTVRPYAYANALGHQTDEDGKEPRSHEKLLRHRTMEDVEDYGVFNTIQSFDEEVCTILTPALCQGHWLEVIVTAV